MAITKLGRDHRYWLLPQCEANVNDSTKRWRDHSGKDYRCERKALYELDGKKMCELHAGSALIKLELSKA